MNQSHAVASISGTHPLELQDMCRAGARLFLLHWRLGQRQTPSGTSSSSSLVLEGWTQPLLTSPRGTMLVLNLPTLITKPSQSCGQVGQKDHSQSGLVLWKNRKQKNCIWFPSPVIWQLCSLPVASIAWTLLGRGDDKRERFGCSSICSDPKKVEATGWGQAVKGSRHGSHPTRHFPVSWAGCPLSATGAWQQFLWLLLPQKEFCCRPLA